MSSYEVHGPFDVSYEKRKGGRTLSFDGFWDEEADAGYLANEKGCYVFAIGTGGGALPIYVGKATKTFKQEVFNFSNREKYKDGFSEYARGKPLMFFVVHPVKKGPTNARMIAEIEDFLIQAGAARNPYIQNVRGIKKPKWSIKGVVRSGGGKQTEFESQFARLFGIQHLKRKNAKHIA